MQKLELKNKIETKIISDPEEIIQHLQIGINIPILPGFRKYILGDIESYGAKAIILEKNISTERFKSKTNKVIGNVLIYDDGGDILFFGFFGVLDHDPKKIEFLLDVLMDYAKQKGYNYIRGPINIPTCIFGWGFMVEGSNKDLFICCPVNPPIYQEIFLEKNFYIKFEEDRYHMFVMKMDPHNLPRYDFSDYEYANPGREGMPAAKDDYVRLHTSYMPPSARITPRSERNFDNLVDFIFTYGKECMMWVVYYKPTKEMVACGYVIPNPFSTDNRGRMNSLSFHDWVVHPDHRRKGLSMLMYGESSLRVLNRKLKNFIKLGSWPVGAENEANAKNAQKMKGVKDRTHLILEYKL